MFPPSDSQFLGEDRSSAILILPSSENTALYKIAGQELPFEKIFNSLRHVTQILKDRSRRVAGSRISGHVSSRCAAG